jgi:hypothetical protein
MRMVRLWAIGNRRMRSAAALVSDCARDTALSADYLPSEAGHPGDYRTFAINARDSCSSDRTSRRSA